MMTIVSMPVAFYGAPVSANIVINNAPYLPQNPLQNINDRLLLPFREISEAIGAQVQWDAATRRILTTFGNRYSIMHIDSPTVTYGTFTRDLNGDMVLGESSTRLLEDVMPQLIGSLTYIPLRVFVETLGADVNWSAATSTAFITATPTVAPTTPNEPATPTTPTTPTAPTEPSRPANFGDFSNTSFFRIISASAVRNMYRDSENDPFAVVLYDSSLDSSKAIVPNIQDVAQKLRFQIYGVDMADTNNREQDNSWLWTYFRQNQFVDPTLYFVRRGRVTQLQAPDKLDEIEDALVRFRSEVDTGIAHGDFSNTSYFATRTDAFIAREIDNRNEFIVVLYNSREPDSAQYVPIIKAAAAARELQIHAIDTDRHPNFHRTISWFSDFRDYNDLPIMFLVYRNRSDMRSYSQPPSVSHAMGYIDEFIQNRLSSGSNTNFPDEVRNGFFRNENIVHLRNLRDDDPINNEFLIFIYNSSDSTQRQLVEDFADNANTATSGFMTRVYGVNRASTVFNQNHNDSNFAWLSLGSLLNRTAPVLVRVTRNGIEAYPTSANASVNLNQFNSQMWHWLATRN